MNPKDNSSPDTPSNDSGTKVGRRRLVKALGAGASGVIVSQWSKPIVDSVIVPLHAQASLYSQRHASIRAWAWARVVNQCSFRHSSRKRPLKDSMWSKPIVDSVIVPLHAQASPPPPHQGLAVGYRDLLATTTTTTTGLSRYVQLQRTRATVCHRSRH